MRMDIGPKSPQVREGLELGEKRGRYELLPAFEILTLAVFLYAFGRLARRRTTARWRLWAAQSKVLSVFVGIAGLLVLLVLLDANKVPRPAEAKDSLQFAVVTSDGRARAHYYSERNELGVPVGRPITLTFVNNSRYPCSLTIPEWKIELNAGPDESRYTTLTFEKPNIAWMYIRGEGCDNVMRRPATAMLAGAFEDWALAPLKDEADANAGERGRRKWETLCSACHLPDSTLVGVGPPLKDLYGSQVTFSDGTTTIVDGPVVRWALLSPITRPHDIRYSDTRISFEGQLSRSSVEAIVEYMRQNSALTPALPNPK